MAEVEQGRPRSSESVAVVVVTYNRADLLVGMLEGLATLATDRMELRRAENSRRAVLASPFAARWNRAR